MDRPLQDQCSQSRQLLRALMPYSCKLPVSKEESFRENNILEQNNVFSSEVRTSIADMLSDETSLGKTLELFHSSQAICGPWYQFRMLPY